MNGSTTNDSSARPHEREVPEVHTATLLLGIANTAVNLILNLPTNLYVLWLIVTRAGGLAASEFFALNLAVTEIFYCLSSVLSLFYYYHVSKLLFQAATFLAGFTIFGRLLFMCSICVERYLAVVHPVVFLRYRPLRYRVACSGLVWLTVLGLSVLSVFTRYQPFTYVILGVYLVMISVKLFCCVSVLRALKRPGPGEREREGEGMNDMKRKAFKIILIVMVSMFVTYLPLVGAMIIFPYVDLFRYLLASAISLSIFVVTGFVQPLLYLQRAGKLPCVMGF